MKVVQPFKGTHTPTRKDLQNVPAVTVSTLEFNSRFIKCFIQSQHNVII